jgi:hypothetical protein
LSELSVIYKKIGQYLPPVPMSVYIDHTFKLTSLYTGSRHN